MDQTSPAHRSSRGAEWAEDASVIFGVAGAVLSVGTGLVLFWLAFWGVLGTDDLVLGIVAGVDLALILLAVTCHHLSVELAEPDLRPVRTGRREGRPVGSSRVAGRTRAPARG